MKPICIDELNTTIKTLKKGKSCGPDKIPNEALIETNTKIRQIYLDMFNKIYDEEKIPKEWQEGEILRLYKGKGERGKCSNERGITLSSNMGKLFERIINNRIQNVVKFTEFQAGGQQGKSTADHINILKSLINHSKLSRKPIYIIFLDVTKAYDKAWLNAILYVLHKNGLNGKNWRIVKHLNENLTAKIKTQYGMTRTIKMKDSIRQGGVLSVIEYANLIDEIAKQLQTEKIGEVKIWDTQTTGCLLWMDDVALIHQDLEELKAMVETTNEIAKRYHIKFGKEKSQILTINGETPSGAITIGDTILDSTTTYKYLGVTTNNRGTMENHIKKTKGSVEAALQTILNLAGSAEFNHMKMATIWRLVDVCITPIITYAAESWTATKAEINQLQRIMDGVLKRILKTPPTTPSEIITAETGIMDIDTTWKKKQIIYYHRIMTSTRSSNTLKQLLTAPRNPWKKILDKAIAETGVDVDQLLEMSKYQAKKYVKKTMKSYQSQKIMTTAHKKSKVRDLIIHRTQKDLQSRPSYIAELPRSDCVSIFKVRARMMKVKANYKGATNDLKCRWCQNNLETQKHILTACPYFTKITNKTPYETYFMNERTATSKTAKILHKIHSIVEAKPYNFLTNTTDDTETSNT